MNDIKKITAVIKGKRILKFYRSIEAENKMQHEDGLGELHWYKLIFEIENGSKYVIGENSLEKFGNDEPLIEFIPESKEPKAHRIVDSVIVEKEYGGLYIKLENNLVLYHDTFFGSELIIDKIENVFDESGKLK